jgi:uncharacterized iron-regulated protein
MRSALIAFAVLAAAALAGAAPDLTLLDLADGRTLTLAEAVPLLRQQRIVLVGEEHTNPDHHRAQLQVIRALADAGAKIAIGLEMFRRESQPALDRWVAGELSANAFEQVYAANWGYPWPAYRAIFEFARDRRIPMIALNVPPDITRQVARNGFQSLSESQRGALSDVTCSVDEEYMRYIRQVFGAHAHGHGNFTFFCEAQMIWDTAMAVHALDYLRARPDDTVVILTGVGHAQKGAVPRQLRLRATAPLPVAALLPEIPGRLDRRTTDLQDADYLITGLK